MNKLRDKFVDSTVEEERLRENRSHKKYWYRWGPYLSERSWATVREDYSLNGDAWSNFPFEHANARVFRWGEDGLFGVSDNKQLVCMNVALWNGKDERLKERLFGLTGPQGNHGEDVKELYFYLDNTPTHSYMKALYKYPFKKAFPYEELVQKNAERGYEDKEFEVYDIDGLYRDNETDDNPYFDTFFEMAKSDENPSELNFRLTIHNRSKIDSGELYVAPQIFFRNTWAFDGTRTKDKPLLERDSEATNLISMTHKKYGNCQMVFQPSPGGFSSNGMKGEEEDDEEVEDIDPLLLFTDNESNLIKLFNEEKNPSEYTKDAFEEYLVHGKSDAVNPENKGTKACAVYHFKNIPPGEYVTVRYKFTNDPESSIFKAQNLAVVDEDEFDLVFDDREGEADNFYWRITPLSISDELRNLQRQAFSGLLWTKQFYNFTYDAWYNGDANIKPRPPPNRANGRNKNWKHLYIEDILSMPDKWEYPFFASWDTAFHCIPLAMIDPEFAKRQLDLLTREWYMHPNGQIPAYEWNFNDVNPPVHAWAVYRVFKIERNMYNREDRTFLERVFQKLLLNFTWWVNRKDTEGKNVFEGGFLGLDNIGVFNRSEPLPTGGTLEQADSTGWMAFFSLQMLNIALELAKENSVYEDIASKFFEHFILISDSMSFEYATDITGEQCKNVIKQNLWNETDKFYYDAISWGDHKEQLPIRSLVGLIPLYASMTLEPSIIKQFSGFKKRVDWFVNNRPEIFGRNIASMSKKGVGERLLLSLVTKERLTAILRRLLDETEFLSPYGIRSLSKYHEKHPFEMNVNGVEYMVKYLPGESDSGMFGGNSNWRGPIWFPTSFLIMEALQRFYLYYGSDFKVECPVGSGDYLNLAEVAEELGYRMIHLFVPDENGERAVHYGDHSKFLSTDPYFKDYVQFFEYFDGDTGRGLGASHQCGWTALVAKWVSDVGISCVRLPRTPRSSVATTASTESSEEGYKMKRMARRKSAKSLVNYTATILDLTEEEKRHHRIGGTHSGLTPQSSISSDKARHLMEEMNEEEGIHEIVVPEDRHDFETKLIGKLKNKVKNMKVTDKAKDEDIDPMDPMSPLNKDLS
ncbi:YMR196W-like protein [Saccharomyces cerevisiae x Saccharomyces kudriavzevii VIN7]|uniref:Mannosyl-oligosaccharide glucosidase n=1 Tax=Saccharomyces cerevisiae x Saccharomyces kudriavzevii (strain VIN7) TaxID=1095631 RepID=H0GZI3_SACCK|nr:YMR196W-like protein [Saccharomyces cerevisiae x Saccharomyces kudriavzevii VIN7]